MTTRNGEAAAKALQAARNELEECNVLVTGMTGVGKSTLINALLGREVAETGVGDPVTKEPRFYTEEGVPLTVLDTRGMELGDGARPASEFVAQIDEYALGPSALHVAWYCVDATSARLEPAEETVIEDLATRLPVILVITRSLEAGDDTARRLAEFALARTYLPIGAAVAVQAKERALCGQRFPSHGMDELMGATAEHLDSGKRMAFINAQRASLPLKENEARELISERITAEGELAQRLALLWDADIGRWSIQPVRPQLTELLARVSMTLGGSAERRELLDQAADLDLDVPGRELRDWARAKSGVSAGIEASRALERFASAYLEVAREAVRRDLDGLPPDTNEASRLAEAIAHSS